MDKYSYFFFYDFFDYITWTHINYIGYSLLLFNSATHVRLYKLEIVPISMVQLWLEITNQQQWLTQISILIDM